MPREERRVMERHHDGQEDQESQRVEDHRTRPARPSALSFIQHAPELYAYRPPGLGGEDRDVTPKLTWRKAMRRPIRRCRPGTRSAEAGGRATRPDGRAQPAAVLLAR